MTGLRARLVFALLLFVLLAAIDAATGDAFVLVVACGLLIGPIVNWTAFIRLRMLRRLRATRDLPVIRSLRAAYYAALLLALASTMIAALAAFTVLRAFPGLSIPALSRSWYLLFLAYPMLLIAGPAFEWIVLVPTLGSLDDFSEWDHTQERPDASELGS